MNDYKVADLKPGMRFDKPVYIEGDSVFVPDNLPIKEKDIEKLQKWGIDVVQSEGAPVVETVAPRDPFSVFYTAISPKQKEIYTIFSELTTAVRTIFQNIHVSDDVETSEIDTIVDTIIKNIEKYENEVIQFILYGTQGVYDNAANAVNTSVISLLIGHTMNIPKHRLLQLATGALLHDVGMLRVPNEILNKEGGLSPSELQKVKTHTIQSFKIITKELRYPEEIGFAGLQHHERWDGEGYPKNLSGSKIHLSARIVAVADSFQAMVSNRPYRDSMIGYRAMRAILSDNGRRFDPEILKFFIKSFGIYPLGSIVLLNNAGIGRVVKNHTDAPLRPSVKIIIDSLGNEFEKDDGEVINLMAEKKLFIARAIDPKEIAQQEGP